MQLKNMAMILSAVMLINYCWSMWKI